MPETALDIGRPELADHWLHKLYPATRFIGYRPDPHEAEHPEEKLQESALRRFIASPAGIKAERCIRVFVGSFAGIAFLALSSRAAWLEKKHAPIVIGAYGAEVVVLFSNPSNPFAQPRTAILGNTGSAIIGIGLNKLFRKSSGYQISNPDGENWAYGALAVAVSFLWMELFNLAHPPGGATALLAATLPAAANMGWTYVADTFVSTLIMVGWALIVNNVGRTRYPVWWCSPKAFSHMEHQDDPQQHRRLHSHSRSRSSHSRKAASPG